MGGMDIRGRGIGPWAISLALMLFSLCFFGTLLNASTVRAATVNNDTENDFSLEVLSVSYPNSKQRSVFIYHTHTYEAYEMDEENQYTPTETWRTADNEYNVVRVGEQLASYLRNAGIAVTHDTTAYEPPRLSSAYSRSLEALKEAGKVGYDLYIDLHRDSYSKGNGENTVMLEDIETARLLFLIGQGTGSSLDEKPDWERNEKAALRIAAALNERADGLCRGVSLKSGRYNQQAAVPSMLIEAGNNKNTLPQALAAMEPLAHAICRYFDILDQGE